MTFYEMISIVEDPLTFLKTNDLKFMQQKLDHKIPRNNHFISFLKNLDMRAFGFAALLETVFHFLSTNRKNFIFIKFDKYRYSFICQGTSTRRQRRDHFGHRFKL